VKDQQPEKGKSMLIFCEKKSRVALVCEALKKAGFPGLPFDESMSSQARNLSLSLLRAGKLPILVSDKTA
jgi:superfamily II DNA/RNA helicase